jgi:hypothetical protein
MTFDMNLPAPGAKKTIAVLGASYAGHRAIQVLVASLPEDWRVVVLERNTHANHLYAFPRMSVVRGHEQKVFIPYTNMFKPALALRDQHQLLHANVLELDQQNRRVSYELINDKAAGVQWLQWDYLVYALGSHLPDPINVWSSSGEQGSRQHDGSKIMGVQWLRDAQDRIEKAESIVIIGGGALGVRKYRLTCAVDDFFRLRHLAHETNEMFTLLCLGETRTGNGYCGDLWPLEESDLDSLSRPVAASLRSVDARESGCAAVRARSRARSRQSCRPWFAEQRQKIVPAPRWASTRR